MSADSNGFTLCIPTKDRSEFLERLLRYYVRTGYRHWIFIGDSSQPQHMERNRRMVAGFSRQLQIVHREYPGESSCGCLEQLSHSITTPYCAFVADDDFLCTAGIERCMASLEEHPECSAVHGKGLMLQTEGGRPYGVIGNVRRYPQAVLTGDTGAERLKEFFTVSLAALLYSVHRTTIWRDMFQGLSTLTGVSNQNIFKDELIPTCVSVVRGKVREVDGLYLVRQAHDAIYRQPHAYDWLTNPEWFPSYRFFRDRLSDELIHQDDLSAEQARAAFKNGFWPYLAQVVSSARSRDMAKGAPAPSRLRDAAKRIPGVRSGWRSVRRMIQQVRDECSLPALLRPSSAYHADFMPLYCVITSEPEPAARTGESIGPKMVETAAVGHG